MPNEKTLSVSKHPTLTGQFDLAETANTVFRLTRLHFKRVQRATGRRVNPLRWFIEELLRSPRQMGAICPSSKALARAMAEGLDLEDDRLVVELGAGTGSATRALLDQGVPADRLIVIERSEILVGRLRGRFPNVKIIQGDAAELPKLLGEQAPDIGGIVSSLPLRSLHSETTDAIIAGILRILEHGGRLIQFTYDLRKPSVPSCPGLTRLESRLVWRNLPPARVDVFGYHDTEPHKGSNAALRPLETASHSLRDAPCLGPFAKL